MDDKTLITLWAMTVIALLEVAAIICGIDGAYFGLVIAVVSALGGHIITKEITSTKPYSVIDD